MERTTVAIVGAGVAGLAASARLRAAGCNAVLVEARGRVGGRIRTLHIERWPAPVELGAEFIHGAPPELMPVASPATEGRDYTRQRGRLHPAGELAFGADGIFERMHAEAGRPDRCFADFLASCRGASPAAHRQALSYVEGFEAADPARISVASLIREQQAEEQEAGEEGWSGPRRPRGGYGKWLRSLQPRGPVWLRSPVEQVCWRRDQVVLRIAGGRELEARHAIVTLPLSLLQRGWPRFDPPLAAKYVALRHLVMGGARRITLRLRQALWPPDLRFLFGASAVTASGHFPTWWAEPLPPGAAGAQITGWAAGRHASTLVGMPIEDLTRRALADLGGLLGTAPAVLRRELVAAHSHDWQADTYSLGGYSYAAVGGADAFAALAEPLENTLFFAGEATDPAGHHATVQGALRSGGRAAAEVLRGI
ncbi:MAG: flavin monoamine oxidase family protein [Terriglobales bacterium]